MQREMVLSSCSAGDQPHLGSSRSQWEALMETLGMAWSLEL